MLYLPLKSGRFLKRTFILALCIFLCLLTLYHSLQADGEGLAISISLVGNDEVYGPGDTVYAITEIRNSDASGRVDVIVTYSLLKNDNAFFSETTTVAIETLSSFSHKFQLPSNLDSGSYLLKASVTSLDHTKYSEAARSINVLKVSEGGQLTIQYVMGIALFLTFVALFFEHRRITKMKLVTSDLDRYVNTN